MPHSICFGGRRLRRVLFAGAALCAFPHAALAGDVAPTPEGAQKLADLLALYIGRTATSVTAEGDHYSIAFDFAKLLAPLSAKGVSVDAPPSKLDVTEQNDGAWRVARDGYPAMTMHMKDGDLSVNAEGYKFAGLFDPAIGGFRSADGKVDKVGVQLHSPDVDETVAIGPSHATATGAAASGGGFSGAWREELSDISMLVTAKQKDAAQAAPAPVSMKLAGMSLDASFDNMRMRELLDLWAFFMAHPSRAELASDEDGLKAKLRSLLPFADKLDENFAAQDIVVQSPKGPVSIGDVKGHFGVEKFPSKADNEIRLAFSRIALPPGVAPPFLVDLTPTSVEVNVKVAGYDYAAAAEEAINDMHLGGEGPILSEADGAKISLKMMSGGPIAVTILPSRILAPQLDLTVEGAIQVAGARPIGTITLRARNFDNTIAAIKNAGPLATPQVLGGLTMAKGLGKADADGTLIWVAEYAADGAIKVNGLPLGKAPAP
jgi:hypothetical protein